MNLLAKTKNLFLKVTQNFTRRELLVFLAILAVGIFLRTYQFSSGLLFEIDQSYDTRIVSKAVTEGIENLPLLGPTAGGGRALRLGPAFYYLEYLSAKTFGDTPTGHAMLVLLSSILALPLFYFFARRYFSVKLSLLGMALFTTSLFLVLYGRFSWSPNVLPFLILASFYALLRSVDQSETRKNFWFLLATFFIAITSQIHFNSFFTIPTVAVLFLLYKRPRFAWRTWLAALGIVCVIYSPMIFSDLKTHGENINFFLKKISKGGSPGKNILTKATLDTNYAASEFLFIITGSDHVNGKRLTDNGFKLDENLKWRLSALALFMLELLILLKNFWQEKNPARKDFLVLVALWLAIPLLYFYSLLSGNFHMYPRFFLLLAPLAIIFWGFLLEKIAANSRGLRFYAICFLTAILIMLNLSKLGNHFVFLSGNISKDATIEREDIFPNPNRLTLKEQQDVAKYIQSQAQKNNYPVYLSTYGEYEPIFWYHLNKLGISYMDNFDENNIHAKGNYFLIKYFNVGTREINNDFEIADKKKFEVLTVYTLKPRATSIRDEMQTPNDRKQLTQTKQINELITWKDLFAQKKIAFCYFLFFR